jgi:hypothetical protein
MRPLAWHEETARARQGVAETKQREALQMLRDAFRLEQEARETLKRVAKAREQGKTELKVQ